jgi:heptosyltransferase-2
MSSVENCVSLSKLNIEKIIPIIASCQYYIGNDTGFGHLSANLNSKCLMIFCDSPINYGLWNNNIRVILPAGETIESFVGHDALAKDKISFDEVLEKSLNLIN